MLKRTLRFVAAALAAALLLLSNVAPVAFAGQVNLAFWFYVSGPNFDNVKALVEEFNAAHPHIHVDVSLETSWGEKLRTALAGGVPPNVVWMPWISVASYADMGVLVNLHELMERDGTLNAYAGDFFPPLWETSKHNGDVYALPFDTNNMLMYYNRDILNQFGVADPPEDWTWSEFVEIARRIASPPDRYSYSAINDWRHFIDWLGSAGGAVLTPDGGEITLDSPETREALQYMFDLVHTHELAPPPQAGAEFWRTAFAEGRLAFEVQGSYRLPQYSVLGTTNLGAVAQPQLRQRYSSLGGESVVILDTTPEENEAAWTFIQWMTNTYANAKWSAISGYIPVRRSSVQHEMYQDVLMGDPVRRRFVEEVVYGDRLPSVPGGDQIFNILTRMASGVVDQMIFPEEAIARAVLELRTALFPESEG